MGHAPIAPPDDGAPRGKPGCGSRHLEPETQGSAQAKRRDSFCAAAPSLLLALPCETTKTLSNIAANNLAMRFPVVPPTVEKVEAMVKAAGLAPETVIARVPPFYGEATVEKIAANAVMAGCAPEMMRVLIPLVRAACDERFNLHGVQATTHFAAPLVMINGPVRQELGFWSRQNVFSAMWPAPTARWAGVPVDPAEHWRRAAGWDRHVGAGKSGQVFFLHR